VRNAIYMLILCMGMLSGCSNSILPSSIHTPTAPPTGTLSITPTDLFAGEGAKFKPFMGSMSGAVQLKYEGSQRQMKSEIEIWENGAKTKTIAEMNTNIWDDQKSKGTFDGEFAVSVKDENLDGKTPQYAVTSAFIMGQGSSSSEMRINKKAAYRLASALQLNQTVVVADNQSTAVWGIQATNQNGLETGSSIQDALKKAEWALVCKISVGE
jgi:hypothetical protein